VNRGTVLDHLGALIAFDTQNPPRNLDAGAPLWDYLHAALGSAFEISLTDHGKGRLSFLAVRGAPDLLFNVHLDTVPVLGGARFPPLEMTLHEGRAYGRGACDIKGAAACLLQLAQSGDEPLALLFTTDEEGAEGCCVERFIAAGQCAPFRQVVVAEPTGCRAETRHRGYLSVKGRFRGVGGHSSERRSLTDNAIHRMSRWIGAAVHEALQEDALGRRTCFNVGTVSGGVKSNVIADRAELHWSVRLVPGQDNESFLERFLGLEAAGHADWNVPFSGPPLPDREGADRQAREFARAHGLELGAGLDFWTEASLFSAAGIPALVLGPGHIEQAHVVDEWVSLAQLEAALEVYAHLVRSNA
jgi:acetylornithine deacetylase